MFEHIVLSSKITGVAVLEETTVASRMACSQRCVTTPECKSFNICYRRVCQLNVGDIFSKGSELVEDSSCIYVGMERDFVPRCRERGVEKQITDDENAGTRCTSIVWLFFHKKVLIQL